MNSDGLMGNPKWGKMWIWGLGADFMQEFRLQRAQPRGVVPPTAPARMELDLRSPRGRAPELLYIKSTRKEQTLILAWVLTGKSDLPRLY